MENKNAWNKYKAKDLKDLNRVCDEYKEFISKGKIERECVELTIDLVKKAGYKDIIEYIKSGKKLKKGDKVYQIRDIQTLEVLEEGFSTRDGIMGRRSHLPVMKAGVTACSVIEAERLIPEF